MPLLYSTATTSIVVVSWNGSSLLPKCLNSLLAQVGLDGPLEIVVVDNGSTDDTLRMLAVDYPLVRVVSLPENLGFTGGANVGIEVSSGDVVGLLNNDAMADPNFVSRARQTLEEHPDVGAVTGLILLDGLYSPAAPHTAGALISATGDSWIRNHTGIALVNSTGGEVTRSANGRDRDWLAPANTLQRSGGNVPGFSGGAVLLRRTALNNVGTFDERLFMYYEDSDMSWRLRRAGWSILFDPSAVVVHQHAASSGTETSFFLYHNERNRLLFALRHAPASVVLAAYVRTGASILRELFHGNTQAVWRKLRALIGSLRLAPQFLGDRWDLNRRASVSRAETWRGAPRD